MQGHISDLNAKNKIVGQVWGGLCLYSLLLKRLKQEDHLTTEFKTSLGTTVRPCLKISQSLGILEME